MLGGPRSRRGRLTVSGHVVVLSGGLDSTVCMALAAAAGGTAPLALTFDYGQRHRTELGRAAGVAGHYAAEHLVVHLDASAWGGSSLTDRSRPVPLGGTEGASPRPTCPPATASSSPWPSVWPRHAISTTCGSGSTPSTTPATRTAGPPSSTPSGPSPPPGSGAGRGQPGGHPHPLIERTKAEIVALGLSYDAPLELTWSCYAGGERPCGACDACLLRARGFTEAGVADPALG